MWQGENEFTVSLMRDVGENYLVVSLDNRKRVIAHQLEIMNRNPHPCFLAVEERKSNEQTKLYYRLNSRAPLRYYLEREAMTSGEVIKVLDTIVGILTESKNYLFYATSFLLQQDYIYLTPTTQEVSLVYLPAKLPGDAHENFRELLKRIIPSCEDFPKSLVDYSEEQFFNLQGFREQLKKIKYSVQKKGKQMKAGAKVFQLESNLPPKQGKSFEKEDAGEEEGLVIKAKEKKNSARGKKLVVFILLQLVLVIVLAVFSSWFEAQGGAVATYIGLFLVIVACDLLFLKRLFKKE